MNNKTITAMSIAALLLACINTWQIQNIGHAMLYMCDCIELLDKGIKMLSSTSKEKMVLKEL